MTTEPKNLPVEIWDIAGLKPYSKNAKKHPPEQIKKLAAMMKVYGIRPVDVEPDGTIIAGHGRRLAALENGWTKIPVVVRHDLTKAEADAMRLADNQVVSTEYDVELLREELVRLDDAGVNLTEMAGFEEADLSRLLPDLGEMNDDPFTDDITGAVEDQKAENAKKEAEVDSASAPVSDAFGFKRVTVEQSRTIRGFMNWIETTTGKQGIEALMAYIKSPAP